MSETRETQQAEAWRNLAPIAHYTVFCRGDAGYEPVPRTMWLQVAGSGDNLLYRWYANDADDKVGAEWGIPTSDAARAHREGELYARVRDEMPDLRELCRQILETRYFADTITLNDLCGFCRQAAEYRDGCFLLPRDWRPWAPRAVARVWVAGGWRPLARGPYVRVSAADCYPRPELVARALLRAIKEYQAFQPPTTANSC